MKKPPILEKELKSTFYGREVIIKGKVYDYPFKKNDLYQAYSEVVIWYDNGQIAHPGFSYITQLSEEELDKTLNHIANNIKTNPKEYGEQPTILN